MRADTAAGRLTVVTATAPTPNGPLHLGHLSGPYVAADIAARAARLGGARVLTVSGLDPHQNYVPVKARKEGRATGAVLEEYESLIRRGLGVVRVSYDLFIDPRANAGYRERVSRLLGELIAQKAAVIEEATLWRCARCRVTLHHAYVTGECPDCGTASGGGTCEGCGAFTTAASLRDARCALCDGPREPFTAEIPLLRLEDHRDELTQIWARAVLPPRIRELTGNYLETGLPDVPLAYPTDWGIPAAHQDQRIDVWAEMGMGLLAEVARQLDPGTNSLDRYRAAWRRPVSCWHFLGLDNAFYFAVLFPALFAAAGIPPGWLGGMVVNQFYRLDGLKFSTSRNHALWAHDFLAGEDPALARLFLCWDRPDRDENSFTRHAFAAFCDWAERALHGPGTVPPELVKAELARARNALSLASFDPALALRCLMAAGAGRAPRLLAALTGESPERPTTGGSPHTSGESSI